MTARNCTSRPRCSSAALAQKLQAVGSIDGYTIGDGDMGPAVTELEQVFHDIVRGKDPRFPEMAYGIY